MTQGLKTRHTLVNIDHAREERQRRIEADREERGLPGPAMTALVGVALTVVATALLYYGSAIVLWGLLWVSGVLR